MGFVLIQVTDLNTYLDKMDKCTIFVPPVHMCQSINPFWFFWGIYMGLVSLYLYENCARQRRTRRLFKEYEEALRQSDEKLDLENHSA
jgi:hypothetical protein